MAERQRPKEVSPHSLTLGSSSQDYFIVMSSSKYYLTVLSLRSAGVVHVFTADVEFNISVTRSPYLCGTNK
jgi:hypothetical protein